MMERLGITFAQAHLVGWHNVAEWASHLGETSATYRARHPKEAAFASALGRAGIAADQFDAIMHLACIVAKVNGARVRQPKPYPRPWGTEDETHFGADPISVAEFDAWYYAEE